MKRIITCLLLGLSLVTANEDIDLSLKDKTRVLATIIYESSKDSVSHLLRFIRKHPVQSAFWVSVFMVNPVDAVVMMAPPELTPSCFCVCKEHPQGYMLIQKSYHGKPHGDSRSHLEVCLDMCKEVVTGNPYIYGLLEDLKLFPSFRGSTCPLNTSA